MVQLASPPIPFLQAGITPLLHLPTLRLLLPVLTTLSVCTAPSVGITGENLTGVLGSEFNESSNKEDTSSSIIGSPARFTDGSKSPLNWYKSSLLNCCCVSRGGTTSNILSLAYSSPPPSRDFRAGITPLLHLPTLRLLLPVLTTLSVCTAPSVGITGENLTGVLGSEFNESSNKEDTSSSIIGSPARFTDGSKSQLSERTEIETEAEASLSLSSATSLQASTSGANP
ncbi:hypothetical protein AYI68_g1122 [Smittium mucronatum]|uniref:Uncharacterized protein n=1 Tax=Smittium mucronatum TaxID=133383 RepID=A0A1R0H6E3_9FUNG|nr:hypothetical protein AYI68_g1122 [Smittium mucronatum]